MPRAHWVKRCNTFCIAHPCPLPSFSNGSLHFATNRSTSIPWPRYLSIAALGYLPAPPVVPPHTNISTCHCCHPEPHPCVRLSLTAGVSTVVTCPQATGEACGPATALRFATLHSGSRKGFGCPSPRVWLEVITCHSRWLAPIGPSAHSLVPACILAPSPFEI